MTTTTTTITVTTAAAAATATATAASRTRTSDAQAHEHIEKLVKQQGAGADPKTQDQTQLGAELYVRMYKYIYQALKQQHNKLCFRW